MMYGDHRLTFARHEQQLASLLEVCGLRQEEQNFFHRVVLPTGGYRGGRTLQHRPVSWQIVVKSVWF